MLPIKKVQTREATYAIFASPHSNSDLPAGKLIEEIIQIASATLSSGVYEISNFSIMSFG